MVSDFYLFHFFRSGHLSPPFNENRDRPSGQNDEKTSSLEQNPNNRILTSASKFVNPSFFCYYNFKTIIKNKTNMIFPPNSIIASGPVIIENGKVLLNKEMKDCGVTRWLFPGGKAEHGETDLKVICRREVGEEMGIEIEIIKQLKTIERKKDGKKWILHHFLAKRIGEIKPGEDIVDWGWFDINDLPADCSPNVYEIVKDIANGLTPH